MRAATVATCCGLALLLFILPATTNATDDTSKALASSSARQLLAEEGGLIATATDSGSQPVIGSAASSVGANFIPAESKSSTQPEAASAAADSTQQAAAQAAQQPARRQRRQQQEGAQQQRALGRKGGPQLRQAPGGAPPTVFIGDLDDYVLPFCQPTEGVVCSDRDKTALLKAQPAVISLENAYPYAQVKPALSYAGSSVTTLDFLADTFSNKNQGVTKAAVETLAGTEAVNADTTVTTTALQGTVDASRADRAIPDAVSVVADRTAAEGTYEWKSWRPRFTYQIGANYGLPVGLAVVEDTSGK